MTECSMRSENVRLLGRMDPANDPVCLDWTASGFEVNFQGTAMWAELEASVETPDAWVAVCVDGCPVSRFLVEKTRRWYPLVHGMDATLSRTVTLMKESQAMPSSPESTVMVHALRHDGTLLPLPEPALRIEFIGDSYTSGEGELAPQNNTEWMPMWFTACGNYTHYICRALGAERRVLSQSGYGLAWNWKAERGANMSDSYELTVGPLRGAAAEARGCQKPYDFASWPADVVCIRLLSNDVGGMRRLEKVDEMTPELIERSVAFIRTVRRCNPKAHILWILPGSKSIPDIAIKAVEQCRAEGMDRVSYVAIPDITPDEVGARNHPNVAYNQRISKVIAEEIRRITGK